jgi:outer membrane receptor protein involved in Fe transport
MAGGWHRGPVRAPEATVLIVIATAMATPVAASPLVRFDLPAGRLGDVIGKLGSQGNISIGVSDPVADAMRVHAVKGRLTVTDALDRMLKGTGLSYIPVDSQSFRIVRTPPKPLPSRRPLQAERPTDSAADDILVLASKRGTPLQDFPGTVSILDGRSAGFNRTGTAGTDAVVDALPALDSTHLGPGRNKLIIRGIADSSFTGPTQAVVGQYLGDVRLNYNAPDPDLTLYDMNRVEVLEGPQGTLYGAGSLGGIVRLVPEMPDLANTSGSAVAGLSFIHGGGPGNDIAAMINMPLRNDGAAVRAVAYHSTDGGYITDTQRKLNHINSSRTGGGRVDLRIEPGNDWMVDLGGTIQGINNADSQYADRSAPRDMRSSALAQPFDNDYRLGQLTVTKHWRNLSLVSATGVVGHDVAERFDATAQSGGVPTIYDQSSHIMLISNETRLSQQGLDGAGWLVGSSFIANDERLTRDLGPPASPVRIAGVHNAVIQGAIYGELSVRWRNNLTITGGGRVAYSRLIGNLLDSASAEGEPSRSEVELLPSFAIAWRPIHRLTAYLRYQEGFRPGGLSVAPGPSGLTSQRYRGDNIATFEGGMRFGDAARDRLSASIGLSFARWKNIQADLVDGEGLPFTANIGTGRILGLETKFAWRLLPGLTAEASLFLNDSELVDAAPGFETARTSELPDVAELGARGAIAYQTKLSEKLSLTVDASIRYFGHSRLGVGPMLNIEQGNYTDTAVSARIGGRNFGISISASNLLDSARNRFSLGNPFGVTSGQQTTPQQPRTIRIGIDGHF